jgi:hypothetical protein
MRFALVVLRDSAIAALCLSLAALAEPPRNEPNAASTYLVTRLRSNELAMLRNARLRNTSTGEDVVIKRGKPPAMIEVEPGTYYLRRVDTAYFNLASIQIPEPEQAFELQVGRVNYIGDLHIVLTESPGLSMSWEFVPNPETVREAAALYPDEFRRAPPVFLTPGEPPTPVELDQPATPSN